MGSRPMCACTCRRRSVIIFCADLDSSCVRLKEVRPCTIVADRTPRTMGVKSCICLCRTTLSTKMQLLTPIVLGVDLRQLRLRLLRLALLVAEPRDEAFEPGDVLRHAGRGLGCMLRTLGLLATPGVPRAGEEERATAFELEH